MEVEVAQPREAIKNKDEIVKKLVKERAANKSGQLFKLGLQVANARIVTQECCAMVEEAKENKPGQRNNIKTQQSRMQLPLMNNLLHRRRKTR